MAPSFSGLTEASLNLHEVEADLDIGGRSPQARPSEGPLEMDINWIGLVVGQY